MEDNFEDHLNESEERDLNMINEDQFQDMDFENQMYVEQLKDQFVKDHINIEDKRGDYLPL
jgi:hypothetical protein